MRSLGGEEAGVGDTLKTPTAYRYGSVMFWSAARIAADFS